MHAYLIVDQNSKGERIEELAKSLHAKILEFPVLKIEDTRNLNNLIRLSFDEATLIVCKNIHEATEEALNALLKNLEEPQENVFFALTTVSVRKVMPTIISRCQILRVVNERGALDNQKEIDAFLRKSLGEKLSYIDKIKDRQEAIELVENSVYLLHSKLHLDGVKYSKLGKNIEVLEETLTRLKANGNVNLHLSFLAINLI